MAKQYSVNGTAQVVQCGANGTVLQIPAGVTVTVAETAADLSGAPMTLPAPGVYAWNYPSCVVTTSGAIVTKPK
jgi:hypothetical protein